MKANSKGFTLIELMVSFFISLLIILGVTYSYKTIILGWNKTEKLYNQLQNFIYIKRILTENLKGIVYRGNLFFKGNLNYLVFFTQTNGLHIPGLTEIGYYFKNNNLKICYSIISNQEDIFDVYVLENTGKCINFQNIKEISFSYGFRETIEKINFFDEADKKPQFLKLNFKTEALDEELLFNL